MTKLSNLNAGLVNLFAVLLPGLIATAFLADFISGRIHLLSNNDIPWLMSYILLTFKETAWVLAYIIVSFVLGYIIYLIAALFDDLFEVIRKWRLEQGARSAVENDELYLDIQLLKIDLFDKDQNAIPQNNFQWAKTFLVQKCPNAFIEVAKLEAEARFFRSFCVIAFISILYCWYKNSDFIGLIAMLVMLMSFLRYYNRRLKSNTLAYLHVLTFERLKDHENDKADDR